MNPAGLEPEQFSLRNLFVVVTLCCILFAASRVPLMLFVTFAIGIAVYLAAAFRDDLFLVLVGLGLMYGSLLLYVVLS